MAETGHCDLDFIYQPPSRHREQVFRLLCQQITGGNVLDVGCGAVGHYWALAYAGRVSSFTLSDKDRGMIELEMQRIEMLTPDTLNVRFPGTLSLLDTLDASRTTLERVQALHRKLADCVVLDCSKASISNRYDGIIANELFENL
ncbi:MAG: hypothetical protein J0M12_12015, partial [Deltaproteobacteria bacterium]|nr:hypothetical protein [Deltaproteobacteria bacterium]